MQEKFVFVLFRNSLFIRSIQVHPLLLIIHKARGWIFRGSGAEMRILTSLNYMRPKSFLKHLAGKIKHCRLFNVCSVFNVLLQLKIYVVLHYLMY